MQASHSSVLNRDDTILGVCEALGEDFGFNPIWLRISLAVLLLWNPTVVVTGYVATGLVIAVSRWLVPNPRSAPLEPWTAEGAAMDGTAPAQGELALAA